MAMREEEGREGDDCDLLPVSTDPGPSHFNSLGGRQERITLPWLHYWGKLFQATCKDRLQTKKSQMKNSGNKLNSFTGSLYFDS